MNRMQAAVWADQRGRRGGLRGRGRCGFTLLELVIVLGVILILGGLVLVGVNQLSRSTKKSATRTTLENLRSMLAEYELKTKLKSKPAVWLWRDPSGGDGLTVDPTISPYDAMALDFWKAAFRTGAATDPPDPLDAPGDVSKDGYTNWKYRHGSRAVLNTQLVMGLLRQVSANTKAMAALPAQSLMELQWTSATGTQLPGPGADGFLDEPKTSESVHYVPGNYVVHNGSRYRCTTAHVAGSPPPGGNWQALTSGGMPPLVLDAWENPIIFVPASGLRVLVNGQRFIVVSPEGEVDNSTNPPTLRTPGRPFFASAGEDGDFAKGDDNLYSFEN